VRRSLIALAATALLCATTAAPSQADATADPNSSVDNSTLLEPTSDSGLLNLLGQQGVAYYPVTSMADAFGYQDLDATLVISDDQRLNATDLNAITNSGFGRIIILSNDANTINALFNGDVTLGPLTSRLTAPVQPECAQADASAAGSVEFGDRSATFSHPQNNNNVEACYPVNGAPTLVFDHFGEHDVIALGSTAFFENDRITEAGNAALALRLLGAQSRLVWLAPAFIDDPSLKNCGGTTCSGVESTPAPGSTTTIPAGGGAGGGGGGGGSGASQPTLTSLMPTWIWWALLQLLVAVLLVAYWRGRRLGAVVTEQLPVTVRAAETVEGHARLYRRANAHGRAAELLRKACAGRLAGYFGVPAARAHADPSLLVAPVAARLDVAENLIADLLAGAVPQSEAELVLLADHLDQLEQEVRSS